MKTRIYRAESGGQIVIYPNGIVRMIPGWTSGIVIPLSRNDAARNLMQARANGQRVTLTER